MARFRVLLVDDSEPDRLLARVAFSEHLPDVEVHLAGKDCQELDHCLSRGCFHLVISDYDLGWADGFEVIRRVRQRCPACHVMVYSGMKSPIIKERAMAEQIAFVDKTADLRDLTVIAGYLLGSRAVSGGTAGRQGTPTGASAAGQAEDSEVRMPWNSGRQTS